MLAGTKKKAGKLHGAANPTSQTPTAATRHRLQVPAQGIITTHKQGRKEAEQLSHKHKPTAGAARKPQVH